MERRALADHGVAGAGTRRVCRPSSWRLATRAGRARAEGDLDRAGEAATGRPSIARAPDGDELLDDATPRRPSPSSTIVRVRSARSGAPTAQRMTIGRASRTPAGTSQDDALGPAARGSAGRTGRRRAARRRRRAGAAAASGSRASSVAERLERDAGRASPSGRQRDAEVDVVLGRREQAVRRRAGRLPAGRSSPTVAYGPDVVERARRAGRRRACTAGSISTGSASKRVEARRAGRRASQSGSPSASGSTDAARRRGSERSVGPGATGRGRTVTPERVIRATPPSPASPGG